MKPMIAIFAAVSMLAGISVANAQGAPSDGATGQKATHSGVTKKKTTKPKAGTSGSGYSRHINRNDPSIHQSAGDRDSRGGPK